jgi:hypothetical protein
VLAEVAATAVEYVPGGQGVHREDSMPECSEKVPEIQFEVKDMKHAGIARTVSPAGQSEQL